MKIERTKKLHKQDLICDILQQCWSIKTSSKWQPHNPALGQCSVSALVLQDHFGGDILKTKVKVSDHFYNRIGGHVYDFTSTQFTGNVVYDDDVASREEAMGDCSQSEYRELSRLFDLLWQSEAG